MRAGDSSRRPQNYCSTPRMLCAKRGRYARVEQAHCESASESLRYLKLFREPFCVSASFTPILNFSCGKCLLLHKHQLSLRVPSMRESCGSRPQTQNWPPCPCFPSTWFWRPQRMCHIDLQTASADSVTMVLSSCRRRFPKLFTIACSNFASRRDSFPGSFRKPTKS